MNKGPCSPRDTPIMGVGRTLLSLNQQLMRELASVRRVRLEFDGNWPLLIPDPDGWTVTHATSEHQYTGWIKAPAILEKAHAVLPLDTKWEMRWDKSLKGWRGSPWEPDGKRVPDYIRVPMEQFEELQRLAGLAREAGLV